MFIGLAKPQNVGKWNSSWKFAVQQTSKYQETEKHNWKQFMEFTVNAMQFYNATYVYV